MSTKQYIDSTNVNRLNPATTESKQN